MKLDVQNLPCPAPVLKTKDALNELKLGESLEITLNSSVSKDNVSRYLSSLKQDFSLSQNGDIYVINLVKSADSSAAINTSDYNCELSAKSVKVSKKALYLNESSAGSGAVGQTLLASFLGAFTQCELRPKYIICVNEAVKISANRAHVAFKALKELENLGCEVISCGSCLQAYELTDKLAVGRTTNAYEIANILLECEQITL